MVWSPLQTFLRWIYMVFLGYLRRQRADLQRSWHRLRQFDGFHFGSVKLNGLIWLDLWYNGSKHVFFWANREGDGELRKTSVSQWNFLRLVFEVSRLFESTDLWCVWFFNSRVISIWVRAQIWSGLWRFRDFQYPLRDFGVKRRLDLVSVMNKNSDGRLRILRSDRLIKRNFFWSNWVLFSKLFLTDLQDWFEIIFWRLSDPIISGRGFDVRFALCEVWRFWFCAAGQGWRFPILLVLVRHQIRRIASGDSQWFLQGFIPVEVHGGYDFGYTGSRWFWFQFWFGWKRNLDSRYDFPISLVIRIIRFSQGIYEVCSYLENPKSQIWKYRIICQIRSYVFGLGYWVPGNALLFQRIKNADLSGQQPLRSRVHL